MADRVKRDEKTYEILHEIAENRRKFEIELLWQRSLLFWGFTIAGFAGYAYFFSVPDYEKALLVAGFGFLSSVVWTLVNRGSKFWQKYWEDQIDLVKSESAKYGTNLIFFDDVKKYEKNLSKTKGFWYGARFSPSRLMIALSDYVVASWLFIFIAQAIIINWGLPEKSVVGQIAIVVTAITLIYAVIIIDRTKKHD